ncbi:MAG: winged helix-turn-helix transcriptional regulator [Phycisphaerales bacterium]|nr:winged helix-turn-helix transcriptional regulator [Phycisphaerales bacterium]
MKRNDHAILGTLATIARALGDVNRLRILAALRTGELCVCQLLELLGLAGATVSQHLATLRTAGLIDTRKVGRWVYVARPVAPTPLVATTLANLDEAIEQDATVRADGRKLGTILAIEPAELALRQRGGCCE